MRLTTGEIAAITGGRLVGADVTVDGATQDSRSLRPGQLFVPLVDARDGHDFIGAARVAGAAAHLTERDDDPGPAVWVADTRAALDALGRWARDRLEGPVVGITGSVGKTSTKDLLAAAVAPVLRVGASAKSFNNEIGVPLTLVGLADDVEVAVLEMGARAAGDLTHLCSIARPTIGIVTTVGAAHVGEFGSVAEVAEAKGELPAALPADGTAVLNADVALVAAMATRTAARVITFGAAGDVRAESVSLDDELRPRFRARTPWGDTDVHLAVRGEHNVANALAALAAACVAGAPLDAAAAGMADASLSPWRMELAHTASGAVVVNDAYNANPLSVASALRSLARIPARRRVAVLGVMAELGDDGPAMHREMGELAASLGIEVIAVATPDYGPPPVAGVDAALDALGPVGDGDAVLVKGSRVAGLEVLADRLAG